MKIWLEITWQSSHQWLFALLGSLRIKSCSQNFDEIDPMVNFSNILCQALTRIDPQKCKKGSQVISHFELLGSTCVKGNQKHDCEIECRLGIAAIGKTVCSNDEMTEICSKWDLEVADNINQWLL